MNKRTANLLLTMLIAVALTVLALTFGISFPLLGKVLTLVLVPWPAIYLAFRYGPATAIIAGALAGAAFGIINRPLDDWVTIVLYDVLPLTMTGLAGLFAKNAHKTLNNRRYSSTYLNIWTGSLLSFLAYGLVKFWLVPMVVPGVNSADLGNWGFWASLLGTWALGALVVSLLARWKPSFIIPKRSRYLSRRETSSLLND